MVFQESLMHIGNRLGKLDLTKTDRLRKLIVLDKGSGKIDDKLKDIKEGFYSGCKENGLTTEQIDEVWNMLRSQANYGFNKSHALAYSIISFQCSLLRTYYPLEWLCALLSHDDSPKIVNEVKEQGFEIHGPDVNTSNTNWSIDYDNKCFRVGLRSIKGLGEKAVEKVLATRPYASIKDFMLRSKANKTALEAFIKSEAFGSLDTSEFKSYRHMFGVLVDNKAKIKDDETYKLILDQYAGETKEWSIYEKIKNQIETIVFYNKTRSFRSGFLSFHKST